MGKPIVAVQVARAERPWTDLRGVGLRVSRTSDGWTFGTWPHQPMRFSREHLDAALANLLTPEARREWASFVLAADFYEVEDEALKDGLWDLAFG